MKKWARDLFKLTALLFLSFDAALAQSPSVERGVECIAIASDQLALIVIWSEAGVINPPRDDLKELELERIAMIMMVMEDARQLRLSIDDFEAQLRARLSEKAESRIERLARESLEDVIFELNRCREYFGMSNLQALRDELRSQ